MTLSWILNRKTPVPVHLSPASALLLAYRLHRMSRRLLLLWVRYNSLRLILQPFSGRRTLCLRQSHRTFSLQDTYHTQLLAGNQLWKEWLLCHSHNHRGLSQQIPRTQLIRSQLEQQNFEMMNSLQQKNQQQIKDLSSQLRTGLQAFLQQSIEQMFNCLAPAQTQPSAATSTTPPPHIVSITPVSAIPPAKAEEPMDSAPSQPAPPEVKKGLSKVKGSSAIAQQSIQAVVSQVKVPTTTPSTQPSSLQTTASGPRLASPLQALEQEEYGTDASASSFSSSSNPEDPTEVGEQVAPPYLPFRELVQKVREFLSIPDPAAEEDYKLGSAQGRDPLLLQQEKLDRPHLSCSQWLPTYLTFRLPRMTQSN